MLALAEVTWFNMDFQYDSCSMFISGLYVFTVSNLLIYNSTQGRSRVLFDPICSMFVARVVSYAQTIQFLFIFLCVWSIFSFVWYRMIMLYNLSYVVYSHACGIVWLCITILFMWYIFIRVVSSDYVLQFALCDIISFVWYRLTKYCISLFFCTWFSFLLFRKFSCPRSLLIFFFFWHFLEAMVFNSWFVC